MSRTHPQPPSRPDSPHQSPVNPVFPQRLVGEHHREEDPPVELAEVGLVGLPGRAVGELGEVEVFASNTRSYTRIAARNAVRISSQLNQMQPKYACKPIMLNAHADYTLKRISSNSDKNLRDPWTRRCPYRCAFGRHYPSKGPQQRRRPCEYKVPRRFA